MKYLMFVVCVVALSLAVPAAEAQQQAVAPASRQKTLAATMNVYVFPDKDQTSGRQSTDESTCYNWAVQNTGTDPFQLQKQEQAQQQQAEQAKAQAGAVGTGAGAQLPTARAETAAELEAASGEGGDSGDDSVPEWAEDGRNTLALFVGFTDADSDSGPSLGIDYEYRLGSLFGIGGTIEYTGADVREGVVAVSFDWHVWKELKVFIAPGAEIELADGTDEFLVRLGIEYGFDIGKKWEAAPALNFDVTSEEGAIVLGVGFGRKF